MTYRKLFFVDREELRTFLEAAWRDGNGTIDSQPEAFVTGRVDAILADAMQRLTDAAHDPLGYDTTDEAAAIRQMTQDALSGKDEDAVQAEIDRVNRRWKP